MTLSEAALSAFRDVVGPDHVITGPAPLAQAMTATFATSAEIPSIVRPASRDEVRGCLDVANRLLVPVYPTSCGKNWGFGSRVPTRSGSVLLDLGRMNRIVDHDETLATITVEPGVSFAQAYEFLREKKSKLFLSTTGTSPSASVLANALERGDGSGPYGDRVHHVSAMEVVLPTGEVVHTGMDRFEGAKAKTALRSGPGPAFEGLFSQSNLGIVTRMTLWLARLPRSLAVVRFRVDTPEKLRTMVDACRVLRLDGTFRSSVGIWNDYRVASTHGQYPWHLTNGQTPLPRDLLDTMKQALGGGAWFGSTALYAPTAIQGRAAVAHVERSLRPYVDHLDVDVRTGNPESGKELFAEHDPAFLFLQGIPHEKSLRSLYWRKRMPIPEPIDADRDRCGALWISLALPFRGQDVVACVERLEALMLGHGFEPMIAMIGQTERALYLVPLILYDRDAPDADEQAMRCHDAIVTELSAMGYPPYRLGLPSMDLLPRPRDDHGALLARIKKALDPNDILAPGRYDFRETWSEAMDRE
jgi:4-cresol dehydrogenase (hydroxylating) flavoprotein subunit